MTSAFAVDLWVLLGAVVQCALVLRARRFPAAGWGPALGLLLALPVAFLFSMRLMPPGRVGFGLIGLELGVLCAGYYVMRRAPARLTSAGLVSLTVTFWIAIRPEHPLAGWWLIVAAVSAVSIAYAFGPWRASDGARLLLYVWFLAAAAAIAATGLTGEAVYALILRAGDSVNAVSVGEAALTGAQAFLLVQYAIGLFLLLADDERDPRRKFSARVLADFVSEERLGWKSALALLAQAAALYYARNAGAAAGNDLIGLAALGALAHGAMTGEPAVVRAPAPANRRKARQLGSSPANPS